MSARRRPRQRSSAALSALSRAAEKNAADDLSSMLHRIDLAADGARRRAPDGQMYSRQEFKEFFGGLEEWNAAADEMQKTSIVETPLTSPGIPSAPGTMPAAPVDLVAATAMPAPLPATVPIASTIPAPTLHIGNLSKKGATARAPTGVQDLRVDRQTAFGNPFPMGADGHDEAFRDAVCDACEDLLEDPLSADVDAIAAKYGLRVDGRFRNAAARHALADALGAAEARLRTGESLRLMCWCFPKRCHAEGIAQSLRNRLREAGIEVEIVGRPALHTGRARTAAATPMPDTLNAVVVNPAGGGPDGSGRGRGLPRGRGRGREGRGGVSRLQ